LTSFATATDAPSATFQRFKFVEGAWPVGSEEAREAAVCEDLAAGLTLSAIVGLVVGVADALDFVATGWARLAVASMNRHAFTECGDLFRKAGGCVSA
jgi:hypothetical protein